MKLNVNSLADVQLGTPLLAEGLYFVRIRPDGVKVEPNKKGDGNNLNLTLQVLNDEVFTYEDNKPVANTNHQLTLWDIVSLKETFDESGNLRYSPDKRLKELGIAVGMGEDVVDIDTSDLVGKCCKINLKHRPSQDGYNPKNEVSRYLPISDSDEFESPPL
jgi:hypothetical protein